MVSLCPDANALLTKQATDKKIPKGLAKDWDNEILMIDWSLKKHSLTARAALVTSTTSRVHLYNPPPAPSQDAMATGISTPFRLTIPTIKSSGGTRLTGRDDLDPDRGQRWSLEAGVLQGAGWGDLTPDPFRTPLGSADFISEQGSVRISAIRIDGQGAAARVIRPGPE